MEFLKTIALVGIGGGAGSILRYLTTLLVTRWFAGAFPLATFIANVAGCFAIGLFAGVIEKHYGGSPTLRLLFITGFCGGYTTFSAFASENLTLIQSHNLFIALAYISLSIITGLLAVWLGIYLAS